MIRSFAVGVITVALVVLFTPVGLLQAQAAKTVPSNVPVEFSGGTPGLNLELFINNGKVADTTVNAQGTASSILDFSNLGKAQVHIYIDDCQDGKTVKVMVAAGQQAEDNGCKRRFVGAGWWNDCGVTRISIDLRKFGAHVVGCGSFFTQPKGYLTTGGALVAGLFLTQVGGGSTTTFASTPVTTSTSNTVSSQPTIVIPPIAPTPTTNTTTPTPTQPTTPTTPIDYAVTVTGGYNHPGGSTSLACILIVTSPPQAAGTYLVTFSGPGVVSSGSFGGVLNSAGRAVVQAIINAFGTYGANVSITSGGTTRTGTASIIVVATQSSCPAL